MAELGALEEVLFVGHTGLVVKLVESAIACPDIQHNVFTSLMKAFHTEDHPKSSAPVILALLTYELFYEDGIEGRDGEEQQVKVKSHPLTLHGSLLLQALLKFQDPRTVVRSLLAQDVEALVRVSCDSSGSHVLTAFLSSHTVPTKKKEKMMKKLVVSWMIDSFNCLVLQVVVLYCKLLSCTASCCLVQQVVVFYCKLLSCTASCCLVLQVVVVYSKLLS